MKASHWDDELILNSFGHLFGQVSDSFPPCWDSWLHNHPFTIHDPLSSGVLIWCVCHLILSNCRSNICTERKVRIKD